MRFPATVLFVLLACMSVSLAPRASAQEQERKLAARLMQPDTTLGAAEQNKAFGGDSGKSFRTDKQANLKTFSFAGRFNATKEFSTKEFLSKDFGSRDAKFATREAPTKPSRESEKTYETKSAQVKDARESGKTYDSRAYADVHDARARGAAQGALDAEQNKGPKTIDDVRELLNKNK